MWDIVDGKRVCVDINECETGDHHCSDYYEGACLNLDDGQGKDPYFFRTRRLSRNPLKASTVHALKDTKAITITAPKFLAQVGESGRTAFVPISMSVKTIQFVVSIKTQLVKTQTEVTTALVKMWVKTLFLTVKTHALVSLGLNWSTTIVLI